mmetsp:Transcript_95818/g.298449  ORF Transcript_95818/g.298449 Transcript_95818/m.298449 type:complete len:210 (+) Transcript_95818:116-745(+)
MVMASPTSSRLSITPSISSSMSWSTMTLLTFFAEAWNTPGAAAKMPVSACTRGFRKQSLRQADAKRVFVLVSFSSSSSTCNALTHPRSQKLSKALRKRLFTVCTAVVSKETSMLSVNKKLSQHSLTLSTMLATCWEERSRFRPVSISLSGGMSTVRKAPAPLPSPWMGSSPSKPSGWNCSLAMMTLPSGSPDGRSSLSHKVKTKVSPTM